MNGNAHRQTTLKSFDLLRAIDATHPLLSKSADIAAEAARVDDYRDVEFVDVEGGLTDSGRDDPHRSSVWDDDDQPHTSYDGRSFTAFNHFIDIKKGPGLFDDYDGYSYERGSAHIDQYQKASEVAEGFWTDLFARLSGKKVDEGINWWFNDEYVHARGQPWYRGCSPALEHYSFPGDKGRYATIEDELKARFPLAAATGGTGRGIPYSVFMPLDNLARYWYNEYIRSRDPLALGPVMHAIQDAVIPHHAAGYNGNWHARYERDLDSRLATWFSEPAFMNQVRDLFNQWNRTDPAPPTHLEVGDWNRVPARNWRIDRLVTWLALNAYRAYAQTYHHFRNGYSFNPESARQLTTLAVTMGALVLNAAAAPDLRGVKTIEFNPATARVTRVGSVWKLLADSVTLLEFPNESEARHALAIIQHYGMNQQCKIGAPTPVMVYYLIHGRAPAGAMASEDAVPFNPATTRVKSVNNRFFLVDGDHSILDLGTDVGAARLALRAIQEYGFTHICFVGRPDPSMVYFRR